VLVILTTHPIQYQVPVWRALAADGRVAFEVWYLTRHGVAPSRDAEFGETFRWDIDLLSGYPHRFLDGGEGVSPADFWACRLRGPLALQLRAAGARALWIQGWQVLAYWQAVRAARAAGCEVWLRGESNDLAPQPLWKQTLRRLRLGRLMSRVDRFFFIGSANRRLYQSFGVAQERLYRSPYAVDNARFAGQAQALRGKRAELRRAWTIPDEAFCVLFCGKFIAKKRPQDLVAAARLLRDDGRLPGIHLLFAGAGALEAELRAQCVRELGEGAASFTGFLNQSEISRAYVAADCLVLPSDFGETWGLVVNEALASGLPCLVSEACGCAEDLAGRDFTFPLGDVAALAGKLARVRSGELRRAPAELPAIGDTVDAVAQAWRDLDARWQ
jgi:glycosyltransferase involved in cell wall biosynthesis